MVGAVGATGNIVGWGDAGAVKAGAIGACGSAGIACGTVAVGIAGGRGSCLGTGIGAGAGATCAGAPAV